MKCEVSSLSMEARPGAREVAEAYVCAVAELAPLPATKRLAFRTAIGEAVDSVIRSGFESDEPALFEMTCEVTPHGLIVRVRDLGLPFDPNVCEAPGEDEAACDPLCGGIDRIGRLVDEFAFTNLGPEGKELRLASYTDNTDRQFGVMCEPDTESPPPARVSADMLRARLFRPEDASAISKLVYRTYGRSYAVEHAYVPERLTALNDTARIVSVVAETESGEIVGHCAMTAHDAVSKTGLVGMAYVRPEFRAQGALKLMTEFLMRRCRTSGVLGLYLTAVTNHVFSQKVADTLGFRACALMPGHLQAGMNFKGLTGAVRDRLAELVMFHFLARPEPAEVYAPSRHKVFLNKIYQNLGVERTFRVPESETFAPISQIKVRSNAYTLPGAATIELRRCGPNAFRETAERLQRLIRSGFENVILSLDLTSPHTYFLTKRFEEIGFFVIGIQPHYFPGDALMLQFLKGVRPRYEEIRVATDEAREIVEYVARMDPNAR